MNISTACHEARRRGHYFHPLAKILWHMWPMRFKIELLPWLQATQVRYQSCTKPSIWRTPEAKYLKNNSACRRPFIWNSPIPQIQQCTCPISHDTQLWNNFVPKCYVVGYGIGTLWDVLDWSITFSSVDVSYRLPPGSLQSMRPIWSKCSREHIFPEQFLPVVYSGKMY